MATAVKTTMTDIKLSPFYSNPEKFLREGQRVRAKRRVYDSPGTDDPGPVMAEAGDLGTCVFVEENFWPTVRFDSTGMATCVTDEEVEVVLFS